MTTLNELLFPVQLIDNPATTNSEYSKIVVADMDGVQTHLNYCSPRFNLLQNVDVFPAIEEMLHNAGCEFSKGYKMNDDSTSSSLKMVLTLESISEDTVTKFILLQS